MLLTPKSGGNQGQSSYYQAFGSELRTVPKELLLGFLLAGRCVCMIGRPASGKSLITEKLRRATDLTPITASELIRSAYGYSGQIMTVMMHGGLVQDDPVITLMKDRLLADDAKNGFLIDGFPRTVNQANWFNNFTRSKSWLEPLIIHLDVNEDLCRQRTKNRANTKHRPDDDMQILERRLHEFNLYSAPAISKFSDKGFLVSVDCSGTKDEMWDNATSGIIRHLTQKALVL